MRNNIYISFPPYIATVLKKELPIRKGEAIRIHSDMKATEYWKNVYPFMGKRGIDKLGNMEYLFIRALREFDQDHINNTNVYRLAFSQRMVDASPELIRRKNLVPFRLPLTIPDGTGQKDTSDNMMMDKEAGQQFRKAMTFHFYSIFKSFLQEAEHEAAMMGEPFTPSEAVQLFCDKYDLTSDDYFNLLRQYYRHPAM